MVSKIYIGPAGWSYKDWAKIVYPTKKNKTFDPLKYLSSFMNLIEINSPFYRPPAVHAVNTWVERVKNNPDFMFTYKLWQKYTHEREVFPGEYEDKIVRQGLDVLKNQEKLGALLVQFPWSFKKTDENLDWLDKILNLYRDYNPVVEIRHDSWNNDEFLSFLNEKGAGFANIDQPVIGKSVGLTGYVTNGIGYIRMHGRNYDNWFSKEANVASRYDYLYNDSELKSITKIIEKIIENSSKIYIIFNNHYRGQAVVNSLQTMHMLSHKKVNAPVCLCESYSVLKDIATAMDITTNQTSLF